MTCYKTEQSADLHHWSRCQGSRCTTNTMYNTDGREKIHWTKLTRLNAVICRPETKLKAGKNFKKSSNPNPAQIRLPRNYEIQIQSTFIKILKCGRI